jgi:tetratricopeptide (TPR) repeat protein
MAWMEVVAMAEKRRTLDPALVAERLAADRQAAEGLERGGRLLDAARSFEAIARTYDGLQDVTFASERAKALKERRDVTRAIQDERRWDEWEARAVARGQALLQVVPDPDTFPSVRQVAAELHLAELHRQAAGKDYAASAARRVLDTFFVDASYYQWRAAMREGSARRALFLQGLALEIDPEAPSAWYRLAIAAATAGDKRQALDALERAEKLGFAAADSVEAEEAFARLRGDPRYLQVLARMRERAK